MAAPFKFSPDQELEIAKRHASGESLIVLAEAFGTTIHTIRRVLERQKVPILRWAFSRKAPQTAFTSDDGHTLAQEYAAGASLQQLAAKYHRSTSAIRTAVHHELLHLRPQGGTPLRFSDEDLCAITTLYQEGWQITKISALFNTTSTRITRALRRARLYKPRSTAHQRIIVGTRRKLTHDGYVLIALAADDPLRSMCIVGPYALEHRVIVARSLNRPLSLKETVHHKNGIRYDNRLENLEVFPSSHPAGIRVKDAIAAKVEELFLAYQLPRPLFQPVLDAVNSLSL